jgi:hypothetical protein
VPVRRTSGRSSTAMATASVMTAPAVPGVSSTAGTATSACVVSLGKLVVPRNQL